MDISSYKLEFQERLRVLDAEESATKSARNIVELDQQSVGRLSRMDAMQQQAMAQATQRLRLEEIRKIHAALSRIEDGEFGFCTDCSEPIPVKRLNIDPTIPRCLSCTLG